MSIHSVPGVHQLLDGIGDLQFAAPGRPDPVDGLVYQGREQVDAHQGQVGRRILGLLHQLLHPPIPVHHRHPEVAGIGHLFEEDDRIRPGSGELVHKFPDAGVDQVVAQVHDEGAVPQEIPGGLYGVGQAERFRLVDVGEAHAPAFTAAQAPFDLVAGLRGVDHPDLPDPGPRQVLHHEVQDRLVGHRHQLFGDAVGQRAEARPLASAQDQSLH